MSMECSDIINILPLNSDYHLSKLWQSTVTATDWIARNVLMASVIRTFSSPSHQEWPRANPASSPTGLFGMAFFYTQEWHFNIPTNAVVSLTVKFIEKYTNAVIVVAELEAWIAKTLVRSNCINTSAIVAYVGMTFAFIYVKTGVSCRC